MQPVKQKKHIAQFKYVVKSVPLSLITIPVKKKMFYMDIGTPVK